MLIMNDGGQLGCRGVGGSPAQGPWGRGFDVIKLTSPWTRACPVRGSRITKRSPDRPGRDICYHGPCLGRPDPRPPRLPDSTVKSCHGNTFDPPRAGGLAIKRTLEGSVEVLIRSSPYGGIYGIGDFDVICGGTNLYGQAPRIHIVRVPETATPPKNIISSVEHNQPLSVEVEYLNATASRSVRSDRKSVV